MAMRIFFIDSVHPILWEKLVAVGHECVDVTTWDRQKIEQAMPGVHGIVIRSRFRIDQEFLEASPDLKFIARSGAGMENIDVHVAESRGVSCLNSPEGNRDAVAEHAMGMLLMLMNNLSRANQEVRKGWWRREENRGVELCGKTVGIIGYGRMGSAFARRLSGFGCTVLAYDKYLDQLPDDNARKVEWGELMQKADIISLHVPLTHETEYMIDRDFMEALCKPIILMNTARGKCLKMADLVAGLRSGKISGACLDVLEFEDVSFERFDMAKSGFMDTQDWQYLASQDRVILSPHIAGWTHESYRKLSEVLFDKISALKTV